MKTASVLIWLAQGMLFAYMATISIRFMMGGETAQRTFRFAIGAKRYESLKSRRPIKDWELKFTGTGLLFILLLAVGCIVRVLLQHTS